MADQVFVTHCLQGDSVKNHAGFSIRATSTQDPELLKFALDYPAYELPLDMWSSDPSPAQAPRRLAFVPAPRNTLALIHSAYAGEDTLGRKGNFFSHIIFYPSLTAVEALESWGAPGWKTSYATGEAKLLPKLEDRPFKGGCVNPEQLTAFLSGRRSNGDQNLATVVYPSRLREDPARCQELLGRTLDGCLHAWNQGAASGRDRLYLVGEPGLVALLLYGVARLLPPEAGARLTFSTFENMHRSLRQFKLGFVCGTYSSDVQKGLDADFFKSRGYGLDILGFPNRVSPELSGDVPPILQELVQFASQGKWQVIRQLHQRHGAGMVSEESLQCARQLYNASLRAKAGKLSTDELLDLARSSQGRELVDTNLELFWALIYGASLTTDRVRHAFSGLLKSRVSELIDKAAETLATGDAQWNVQWGLVRALYGSGENVSALWANLLQKAAKLAPSKAFVASFRLPLLQECQHLGENSGLPPHVQEVLSLATTREFEQLRDAGLPAEWLAFSLGASIDTVGADSWAAECIKTVSDGVLQSFVAKKLSSDKSPQEILRILRVLVPDQQSFRFFFRLVKNGLVLSPDIACRFLDDLNQTKRLSGGWVQDDNLPRFLGSTASFRAQSAPLWLHFCRFISKDLLLGDQAQRSLFDNLLRARDTLRDAVPAEATQTLDDWTCLLNLFTEGKLVGSTKDLEGVCQRRHIQPVELLKEYFAKVVQVHEPHHPRSTRLSDIFMTLFPAGTFYQHHVNRFDTWLKLLKSCRDSTQVAGFQMLFLERCVPREFRMQVAKDRKDLLEQGVFESVPITLEKASTQTQGPQSLLRRAIGGYPLGAALKLLGLLVVTHAAFALGGCWLGTRTVAARPEWDAASPVERNTVEVNRKTLRDFQSAFATLAASLGSFFQEVDPSSTTGSESQGEDKTALDAAAKHLRGVSKWLDLKKDKLAQLQNIQDSVLIKIVGQAVPRSFLTRSALVTFEADLRTFPRKKTRAEIRTKLLRYVEGQGQPKMGICVAPAVLAASCVASSTNSFGAWCSTPIAESFCLSSRLARPTYELLEFLHLAR